VLPAAGQGPEEIVGAGTPLGDEIWSQRQTGKSEFLQKAILSKPERARLLKQEKNI